MVGRLVQRPVRSCEGGQRPTPSKRGILKAMAEAWRVELASERGLSSPRRMQTAAPAPSASHQQAGNRQCPPWFGSTRQRNRKHPKPCSLEKQFLLLQLKCKPIIYMASWKTVQCDSSVRSQKTLRHAPLPTWSCSLDRCYAEHLTAFVLIFVKMVSSMAIVKTQWPDE